MLKNKIIILLLMLLIIFTFCNNIVYAAEGDLPDIETYGTRPSINLNSDSTTTNIINKILGALSVVGVIFVVILIAILGFSSILGSASEKAVTLEKYGGLLVAGILISAGTIIAKFLIEFASKVL